MGEFIKSVYNVCYQEKKVSEKERMIAVMAVGCLLAIPLIVLAVII